MNLTNPLKTRLYLLFIGLTFSLSAFAGTTSAIDGTWVLDKTIPIYCDPHPEPYTTAELHNLHLVQQRLPNNYKLKISGPYAIDFAGEGSQGITSRQMTVKEVALEHYKVFLAGIPEKSLPRLFELRLSPMGEGYIELLNVDTDACGLNNAVATLKLIKLGS